MRFTDRAEAAIWAQFMASAVGSQMALICRNDDRQTDEAFRAEIAARLADAALEEYRKRMAQLMVGEP